MLRRGSRANPAGAPRAGRPGAVAKAAAAAGAAASAAARARCSTRSAAPAARTPRFPSSLAVIGPSTAATASSRSPAPAAAAVGTAVAAAATVVAAAAAVAAATAAVAAVATAAATVVVAAVAAIAAGSREAAGGSLLATSGREPPGLRHTRRTIRKGPTGNRRPGLFLLAWTCRLAGNRLAAVAHAFSNERRNVNWTRGGRPHRGPLHSIATSGTPSAAAPAVGAPSRAGSFEPRVCRREQPQRPHGGNVRLGDHGCARRREPHAPRDRLPGPRGIPRGLRSSLHSPGRGQRETLSVIRCPAPPSEGRC